MCYLNEQPLFNVNQMKNYEEVVKRCLFRFGFDFIHPTFSKREAKKLISKFYQSEYLIQKKFRNFQGFLQNTSLQNKLFREREREVEKLVRSESFEQTIKEQL